MVSLADTFLPISRSFMACNGWKVSIIPVRLSVRVSLKRHNVISLTLSYHYRIAQLSSLAFRRQITVRRLKRSARRAFYASNGGQTGGLTTVCFVCYFGYRWSSKPSIMSLME